MLAGMALVRLHARDRHVPAHALPAFAIRPNNHGMPQMVFEQLVARIHGTVMMRHIHWSSKMQLLDSFILPMGWYVIMYFLIWVKINGNPDLACNKVYLDTYQNNKSQRQ